MLKQAYQKKKSLKLFLNTMGWLSDPQLKLLKNIILAAKKLKVIGRAGAGVDNIDVPTAKEKAI